MSLVRNSQVKLVPMYAYDSRRRNQVYLQEIDRRNESAGATKDSPVLSSPLYEFDSFQGTMSQVCTWRGPHAKPCLL